MRYRFITRELHQADTGQDAGNEAQQPETPKPTAGDDKRFTQADVDEIVKARLKRAEDKAKADQEKARTDAEAKALAEQGEWKTLAEQREKDLTQAQQVIEAAKATERDRDRYKQALTTHVNALRANLPSHLTALLDKLDPVDQLEWMSANHAELTRPNAPDINAGGRGGSNGYQPTDEERRRAEAHYRHAF